MDAMQKIFTDKYTGNLWQGTESRSGPGSSLAKNQKLLRLLRDFCVKMDCKEILDCGCGDFNWMQHFDFSIIQRYIGVDIVQEMLNENMRKYWSWRTSVANIFFVYRNIVTDPLPTTSGLAICKDVLFHLSYDDALKALQNIRASGAKWLIATTFPGFKNHDIPTGNWRRIDMATGPFNLGAPLELWENIEEIAELTGQIEKCMGVWLL